MGDLKNLFKKERLSPRTKIKLALDCAAAMYHLHLQRVLHCVCFFYFIVLLSLPWCHNQTHSGLFLTGPGMQKHIGYHCTGRIYCKGYRYIISIIKGTELGLISFSRLDFGLSKKGGMSISAGNAKDSTVTYGPIKWLVLFLSPAFAFFPSSWYYFIRMSPELLNNEMPTVKSDVWSFGKSLFFLSLLVLPLSLAYSLSLLVGVVLWELLTELPPYSEYSLMEAAQAIKDGETLEIPSFCPPPLSAIIKDCWALEAVNRPDFGEIYDRLEVP